jgi:hypothetical protein
MFTKQKNFSDLKLISRELDRKDGSGKEKWEFKIKNNEYIFTGDVQFLPKEKERVIIIDFCPKNSDTELHSWELTGGSKYWSSLVYGYVIELSCRVLPPIRKYRYVAMCGDFYREKLHLNMIKRLGNVTSDSIVQQVIPFLNPGLQFSIDMGACHCVVGDLITNPYYKN